MMALEDAQDLTITGEENLGVFKSSDWGERCFCKTCGTNLFWRAPEYGHVVVLAGGVDQQDKLALHNEIFIDHAAGWYAFENDTTKMTEAEVMAEFQSGT